ncbi:MAG: hypothetical protein MJZ84_05165 [Paludibacteraceae bacterium]|nr:hypothetical protein [Paludibacteraceae bacterium]
MTTKEILAIVLLSFGSVVVAFAVVVEPSGELDGSVLGFWGETLGAALLLMGIDKFKL